MRDRRALRKSPSSRRGSASTSPRCSSRWTTAARTARASPSTATRRPPGSTKLTLYSADPREDWERSPRARDAFGGTASPVRASHAVVVVDADADEAEAWVASAPRPARDERRARDRDLQGGRAAATTFVRRFALDEFAGTHGLGHTRMATESRVTTEGSHPFSTGHDLCLVHNGSLSNHNRLRERAAPRGDRVPDRERHRGRRRLPRLAAARGRHARAGARGLPRRPRRLLHLPRRARPTGFAVLRDPIACKPAVLAETDDWVAMASEWRAIAVLPGAADGAHVGAGAGRRLRLGARDRRVTAACDRRSRSSTSRRRPLRELNQRLHDLAGDAGAAALAGRQPERRARGRLRARRGRRGRDRGARRLLLRRHEQARDRARARERGHRRRREHDVRHASSSTATRASRRARPAAAGSLVVHGDAAARCGISMKGVDIVVRGSVGHMSAFMAQTRPPRRLRRRRRRARRLDLRGARSTCAGRVAGLGADCVEKELRDEHVAEVREPARAGGHRRRRPVVVPPLRLGAAALHLQGRQRRTDGD